MFPLRSRIPTLLCALLLAAGCGVPTPSPSPSPSPSPARSASPGDDVEAVTAGILAQVEQIRGLEATGTVKPEALSEEELAKYVDRVLAEITDEKWRTSDALLRHLGLIRGEETLQQLFERLLETQIAGFYDPEAGRLVVLAKSGAIGPAERFTMSHELTHMLQDQHFGLEKLDTRGVESGLIREPDDQTDRHLAVLALTEGDATAVMFQWAQGNLTAAELGEIAASDPESLEILNQMPMILRETLLYPYLTGLQFVLARQTAGGWDAVDALYAKPPVSTEQVLHPDKYDAGEDPVEVSLPGDLPGRLGSGWKVALEDTFGELDARVWLQDVGKVAPLAATDAAAGWAGDRLALLEGPDGAWAVAWQTKWDSAADADEFAAAARSAAESLQGAGDAADVHEPDESTVWVLTAEDSTALGRVAGVLGLAG